MMDKTIEPSNDYLYVKLQQKLYLQNSAIENAISKSSLPQSDKDFLVIHFYSCLINNDTKTITQDTLNLLTVNFIKKYSDNAHIEFLRKHIRLKYVPSNWGYGTEFFSGYSFFTNNLKDHFSSNVPIGVAFDLSYKKVVLYLRDYVGIGHTLHDLTDKNVIWPKKSTYNLCLPELSLGYVIHDGKILKLAPFVGIASTDISPTENDIKESPGVEDNQLNFTTTYSIGFNMDIKFGRNIGIGLSSFREESNMIFRIRYAYNLPQFSGKYAGFEGNMHYITLGIGGFGRKLVRDK